MDRALQPYSWEINAFYLLNYVCLQSLYEMIDTYKKQLYQIAYFICYPQIKKNTEAIVYVRCHC